MRTEKLRIRAAVTWCGSYGQSVYWCGSVVAVVVIQHCSDWWLDHIFVACSDEGDVTGWVRSRVGLARCRCCVRTGHERTSSTQLFLQLGSNAQLERRHRRLSAVHTCTATQVILDVRPVALSVCLCVSVTVCLGHARWWFYQLLFINTYRASSTHNSNII